MLDAIAIAPPIDDADDLVLRPPLSQWLVSAYGQWLRQAFFEAWWAAYRDREIGASQVLCIVEQVRFDSAPTRRPIYATSIGNALLRLPQHLADRMLFSFEAGVRRVRFVRFVRRRDTHHQQAFYRLALLREAPAMTMATEPASAQQTVQALDFLEQLRQYGISWTLRPDGSAIDWTGDHKAIPASLRKAARADHHIILAALRDQRARDQRAHATPEQAAAHWQDATTFWFEAVGHHAGELTNFDLDRIERLEAQAKEHVAAARIDDLDRIILLWQRATLPLRWLPHGAWYEGGATYDSQLAVYRAEAKLRGVPDTSLCSPSSYGCGGACTGAP